MSQAYALVRSGKIIKFLEDRYGESEAGIVSNLLLLGHARINDLADAYGVSSKKKARANTLEDHPNGNGLTNGINTEKPNAHIQTLSELHKHLNELLETGFIASVQENHFMPEADVQNQAERLALQKVSGSTIRGAKKQAEINSTIRELKRKWRGDDDDAISGVAQAAKRKRINGLLAQPESSVYTLPLGDSEVSIDVRETSLEQ